MREVINGLIIFFILSMLFTSCGPLKGGLFVPFPSQFSSPWDYAGLHEVTTDSSTDPYTITTFDTNFSIHSQHSYSTPAFDSLVYTDYTITPATVTRGHYNFIYDNGSLFIPLLPSVADTFEYKLLLPVGDTIALSQTINGSKLSQTFTEFYIER
ncbi:MAG TPA: hypothetical protein VK559_02290 [Ferruginibacter sp.]|nr:hypothetical protein [Ferruginibacter sp.]